MDIIPEDSVSVMERPFVLGNKGVHEHQSAISADSSVVGKVNPVMDNFYKQREQIRRRQAERLLKSK